jgi:hypothetical protein
MCKFSFSRAVLAASLLGSVSAQAAESLPSKDISDQGFSYFMGLGQMQSTYQEAVSILPVKSKAKSSSLILLSGALYVLDENYLLSLDSLSTFYPGSSNETWTATAPVFKGITLTSSLLQQNSYNLSLSNTQLALHRRITGDWFVFGGPTFASSSFKRYAFIAGPDNATNITNATVEESASEVLGNIGLALESEQVRDAEIHYSLRASASTPVWRRLQNTSVSQAVFSSTKGYDLALEGRYSWSIHPKVQLGTWGRASHSYRGNEVQGRLELPASTLDNLGVGVELLWKL